MSIEVHPATPDRWDDVVAVFGTRGDPSWCWCQFFVTTGRSYEEDPADNRRALCGQIADADEPPGLLAYDDGVPVGWVQLGPKRGYPRLTDASAADAATWRTTCFVVRVGHRRKGVARALLGASVEFARHHGATALEGEPVDTGGDKKPGANLFHGTRSMFAAAGFSEVDRPRENRPVMRLEL